LPFFKEFLANKKKRDATLEEGYAREVF